MNDSQTDALRALFGLDGLQALRSCCGGRNVDQKVLDRLQSCLETRCKQKQMYFVSFAVEMETKKLVSHYLVFASKHHLGYKIAKEVMAKYSERDGDGIPLWRHKSLSGSQIAIPLGDQLTKLEDRLCKDFAKETIRVDKLLIQCHKGHYLYREKDIKAALCNLECNGLLTVDKLRDQRMRNGRVTLGDNRSVTFC